ncbi:Zinc finger CCHC domain-containing protein 8, partial [Coemansia helicoidea]
VGLTADSRQALGNPCFNCAMPGHELRDCPMPVDEDRTDANRRAFREKGPGQFSGRLYLAVEDERRAGEMRERLRPGLPLSAELCEALGLKSSDEVPAYINNMYMYGYPPAYLGHDVGQDVLQARSVATLQPPPTPTLHIYHDADDFDRAHAAPSDERPDGGDSTAHDKGAEAKIQTPTKGDDVESGEEGAVSESELAAETNGTAGDGPAPTRNIPLVHYTGLDLKQFDFDSSERPGRPIRAQESGRRSHTGYNSTRYASRHAEGGHRYRDRDWEQDDYDPRSYYHTHYPAPYTPAQPYADGWSEMPAGYYGALGR